MKNEKPENERDITIKVIRTALMERTGIRWSVTGGRGTAWGWIKIDAPASRKLAVHVLKEGHKNNDMDDWTEVLQETADGRGHITPEDRATLAKALGLDAVHTDGISIPSSWEHYREYIARAKGQTPEKIAQPYWD